MSNVVHIPYPLERKAVRWMFKPPPPRVGFEFIDAWGGPSLRLQIDRSIDTWRETHPGATAAQVIAALSSLLAFYSRDLPSR